MLKVLIVEDEYITRTFLSSIINWEDNNMVLSGIAKDGVEAINIVEKENIDIVITDLKMPKMDGNELIRELKKRKFDGKIIVLSNYDDFDLVKDAMKNGAFEYMLKVTINKDELLETLNKAINELKESNKLINESSIVEMSSEKLKVNEYVQSYLVGNNNLKINKQIEEKYLTNYTFIYLRVLSTDIQNLEQEKRLSSLISNLISNCATYVNSDIFSLVNIKRNEYGIVIKTSKKNSREDIDLLICNITRNVAQYLNIEFEKILYKECTKIEDSLKLVEDERAEYKYKISSKVLQCRP